MTRLRHPFGEAEWASSIAESASTYLRELERSVPEQTFLSHQNTVQKFTHWHSSQDYQSDNFYPPTQFLEYLIYEEELSVDTVIGNVYSLLNFLAYHFQSTPDILREQLVPGLEALSCSPTSRRALVNEFATKIDTQTRYSVHQLNEYLRHRKYGTRNHVFVELILATTGRPKQVRDLDLSDLDQSGLAEVGVSDNHVVASSGLQQTRTVQLPANLLDLLEVYLEHDRIAPAEGEDDPLLTTSHGRASTSTLRRSVKHASTAAQDSAPAGNSPVNQDALSSVEPETVVPSDIWRVALNEVVENQ